MAKTKSNRRNGGKNQQAKWASADHEERTAKRIASINKKLHRKEQHEDDDNDQDHNNDSAPKRKRQTKKQQHRIRLSTHVPDNAYKRSHLAHDNLDQIESSKLRLAIAQTQRQVDALRERLESWDPVEEEKRARLYADSTEEQVSIEAKMKLHSENVRMDEEARSAAQHDQTLLYAAHGLNKRRKINLKKKPRPGPETWKLRGAARPAWEVYDFDTRFVDVHIQAKEEATIKARRVRNVIALCRGRFALDENGNDHTSSKENNNDCDNSNNNNSLFPPPQPQCRKYLSLLTQLGSLNLERKNYSSARKSFLQVLELEGTQWPKSITNARTQLMNMYLETNRPASARRLWEQLDNDGSAWIRYSAALIEYVSWNLLQEKGSTAHTAERLLTQAIRGNVYVAYFLGWKDNMKKAMEYTEELVEWGDHESGTILEAVEYGCSEDGDKGMGMWEGTEGSLEWVRNVILRVLNGNNNSIEGSNDTIDEKGDGLTKTDLSCWETKLSKEEEAFEKERNEKESSLQKDQHGKDDDDDEKEEEDENPDLLMYAGMFRTGMDWLQDAGDFLKAPSVDYLSNGSQSSENDEGGKEMDIKRNLPKKESDSDSDSEEDDEEESNTNGSDSKSDSE